LSFYRHNNITSKLIERHRVQNCVRPTWWTIIQLSKALRAIIWPFIFILF